MGPDRYNHSKHTIFRTAHPGSTAAAALIFAFMLLVVNLASAQKLEPKYHWAKTIQGSSWSHVSAEALLDDGAGNIYIAGAFRDTVDFDPGPGVTKLIAPRFVLHGFICKLTRNGSFVWARKFDGRIAGCRLTLDPGGNVLMTGGFTDTVDFDPGPATATRIAAYQSDVFVCKLSAAGNLLWARSFEGSAGSDFGRDIKSDAAGNVILTGEFSGTVDFDPGASVSNLSSAGLSDIFISRLDPNGAYLQAWRMGGSGAEMPRELGVDSRGNMYTIGTFSGANADFDPGPGIAALTSQNIDFFVSKLDAGGNYLWAKQFRGGGWSYGTSLAIGTKGDAYICGSFQDTADFDPANPLVSIGTFSQFVCKLDPNGNSVWAKAMKGTEILPSALALDRKDNVIVTGSFSGTVDFNPDTAVVKLSLPTGHAVFVNKLDSAGRFMWVGALTSKHSRSYDVVVDDSGLIYTAGYAVGNFTIDFDPGVGDQSVPMSTNTNAILFKWGEGVIVDQASAVPAVQPVFPLTVFPQPASGIVLIRCADAALYGQPARIYSLSGAPVAVFALRAESELAVSGWLPGVYFLRLPDGRTSRIIRH